MARLTIRAGDPPGAVRYTAQAALDGLAVLSPQVGPLRPRPDGREALQTLQGPEDPFLVFARTLTVSWRLDAQGRATRALSAFLERPDGEVEWRFVAVGARAGRLLGAAVEAVGAGGDPMRPLAQVAQRVEGGRGDDTLEGGLRDDVIAGGRGDDRLHGSAGADRLDGGAGEDRLDYAQLGAALGLGPRQAGLRLDVEAGLVRLPGRFRDAFEDIEGFALTDAADRARDGRGASFVALGGGADRAAMGGGDDRVHGDGGPDRIAGQGGSDLVFGGDGDDRLNGGDGADALWGEGGDDLLRGGAGGDTLDGGAGRDRLFGAAGDDTLRGQDGDDELAGQAGDDRLEGGEGDDLLRGGGGDDDLDGGGGLDRLAGGPGADLFRFGAQGGEALDFEPGLDRAALAGADPADLAFVDVADGVRVEAPEDGPAVLFHGLSAAQLDDPANFLLA
ncbi:calcium-binding protein [Albimonas pacifica]|uniref:Hemolysin-type calcium-binding repeat-containing protein n=1 Tax=Albimonas pacifica TaxID=1114924 RepID=A0A1I3NQU0_9RHOB|nr:calcium-binding protein [Albimonas pacifica]SFJ11340.1 Hemolysin-type calcium-binding repeat-containing protein [Albimonas pacifica]